MDIQTVGILGAGQMGSGIAQVCAIAGIDVIMRDINDAAVQRGIAAITSNFDRAVGKGKMDAAQKDAALARIKGSTDIKALAPADFIIEAATESLALKQTILKEIDVLAKPDAIIATNTSSISITKLAAAMSRPTLATSGQCMGALRITCARSSPSTRSMTM